MISKKNKEWENIGKEFSSRHDEHKRSLTQLKSLWKYLKARTKSADMRYFMTISVIDRGNCCSKQQIYK
jgi:hypothetical protein